MHSFSARDEFENQQQQDQEHQRLVQKNADEAQKQKVEQKHQLQTQQLEQKHAQQQQHLQKMQTPTAAAATIERKATN